MRWPNGFALYGFGGDPTHPHSLCNSRLGIEVRDAKGQTKEARDCG